MSGCYNHAVGRRGITLSVLLAFLYGSCTTPKHALAPRDSRVDRAVTNFSGRYCFVSMAHSFREYNGAIGYLIPRGLADNSVVVVTHDRTQLAIEFNGVDGTHDHVVWNTPGKWENGRLIFPLGSAGNPFGWYYSRSWMTAYRLKDGRLVLQRDDADTGLTCLLIPSHDKRESMIVLEPEARCTQAS